MRLVVVPLTVLGFAAMAGCGGSGSASDEERGARCGELGIAVNSDDCTEEVSRQREDEDCIAREIDGGDLDNCARNDSAVDSEPEGSSRELEEVVASQVSEQFGIELDTIDCGEQQELTAGQTVNCPFSAGGNQATIVATVDDEGPPLAVSVNVTEGQEQAEVPNSQPSGGDQSPTPTPEADQAEGSCGEQGAAEFIKPTTGVSCAEAKAVAQKVEDSSEGGSCKLGPAREADCSVGSTTGQVWSCASEDTALGDVLTRKVQCSAVARAGITFTLKLPI